MANELLNLNTENIDPSITYTLGTYEFSNKDEIAKFLKGAEKYKNILVTTEADYKSGKALRADLKKVSEKINRHRIDKKNEMMAPIDAFENEMKELSNIVDEVKDNVDTSIKGYEEKERAAKQALIDELLKEHSEGYQFIQPKNWLNKGKKLDDIKKEILDLVTQAKVEEENRAKAIKTIQTASESNNLTADGYISLLDAGIEVLDIINQINIAGEKKREIEKQQAEYNQQQQIIEQQQQAVEVVKEDPKPSINEPILRETIQMIGTKSQFNELIKEMMRIGIKVVPIESKVEES